LGSDSCSGSGSSSGQVRIRVRVRVRVRVRIRLNPKPNPNPNPYPDQAPLRTRHSRPSRRRARRRWVPPRRRHPRRSPGGRWLEMAGDRWVPPLRRHLPPSPAICSHLPPPRGGLASCRRRRDCRPPAASLRGSPAAPRPTPQRGRDSPLQAWLGLGLAHRSPDTFFEPSLRGNAVERPLALGAWLGLGLGLGFGLGLGLEGRLTLTLTLTRPPAQAAARQRCRGGKV
jgi:hypothetical protein